MQLCASLAADRLNNLLNKRHKDYNSALAKFYMKLPEQEKELLRLRLSEPPQAFNQLPNLLNPKDPNFDPALKTQYMALSKHEKLRLRLHDRLGILPLDPKPTPSSGSMHTVRLSDGL